MALIGSAVHQARYSIGSDGMSYISIAEHYARGEFATAINGYWSPAISWLMAPFITLGVDGRLAFVVINGLAAVFTVIAGTAIVWRYTRNLVPALLFITAMTGFLSQAVSSIFPDLLLVAWTMLFIGALFGADRAVQKRELKRDIQASLLLGIVGAIGYVVKLYAVPFFLTTIIGWSVVRLCVEQKSDVRRMVRPKVLARHARVPVLVMTFFILIAAPWVLRLSLKYDYFTFGSSFAVNTAASFRPPASNTPPSADREASTASATPSRKAATSVAVPPYETATTTTEDRTPRRGSGKQAVILSKKATISNFLARRQQGIPLYVKKLFTMWPLLLPIVVFTGVWLAAKRRPYKYARHYYLVLLSFGVYFTGYALITGSRGGNPRYFWPLLVFAVLLACFLIGDLGRARLKHRRHLAIVLAVAIGISLLVEYPIRIQNISKQPTRSALENIATDFKNTNSVRKYENYLSNNSRQNRYFAYYVDGQAYGSLSAGHEFTDVGMLKEMKVKDIDYFLHFTTKDHIEFDVAEYGGRIIAQYYLGSTYSACVDKRQAGYRGQCRLYVIQPQY